MQTADTEDYELVKGELVPLSTGTYRHATIRDFIGYLMMIYFRAQSIGKAFYEVECRTINGTVRQPDISVFLNERLVRIELDKVSAPFAPA